MVVSGKRRGPPGRFRSLKPDKLRNLARGGIRLFNVDGGHTEWIVFSDMSLAEATMAVGGIVIADDVFNQDWPGVSIGTLSLYGEWWEVGAVCHRVNKVFSPLPNMRERTAISSGVSLRIGIWSRRPRQQVGRQQSSEARAPARARVAWSFVVIQQDLLDSFAVSLGPRVTDALTSGKDRCADS